jgi:hypothetical protein
LLDTHRDHVADGGYFDNSGIATAMDWLLQALEHEPDLRVALVLIRSFPQAARQATDSLTGAWMNAVYGPLDLMLATETSTQRVRADIEAQLATRGDRVCVFTLQFDTDSSIEPPMSWHLSRAQRAQIDTAWTFAGGNGPSPADVAASIGGWCASGK